MDEHSARVGAPGEPETGSGPTLATLNPSIQWSIFSHLPAKTLASLAMTSRITSTVANDEAVWRNAFKQDFPYHFNALSSSAPHTFRTYYSNRIRIDKNWAQGSLAAPFHALRARQGHNVAVTALRDPFPNGIVLGGGSVDVSEDVGDTSGQVVAWHLTSEADLHRIGCDVKEHGNTNPDPNATGISGMVFCITQRPGLPQIVVNPASGKSAVLELRPGQPHAGTISNDGNAMDMDGPADSPLHEQGGFNLSYVKLYDLQDNEGSGSMVDCVNDYVMAGSFDGLARLYQPPRDGAPELAPDQIHASMGIKPLATFRDDSQNDPIVGAMISADVSTAATAGNDMQVKIWDTRSQRVTTRMLGHAGWIWGLQTLDDSLNVVVSGATDGTVRLWDTRSGQQTGVASISEQHGGAVYPIGGMKLRPDHCQLAIGCLDDNVYVMDMRTMKIASPLRGHTNRVARVDVMGDTVLSACMDGTVGVWRF